MVAFVKPHRSVMPDPSIVSILWRNAIIEAHRYADPVSRVLARHEDVGAKGVQFPNLQALEGLGINVDALATCLDCGTIAASEVSELVDRVISNELSAEEFDERVALTLIPTSVDITLSFAERRTAAAHLPDVLQAARMHPEDHLERALHSKGMCSCHVEMLQVAVG